MKSIYEMLISGEKALAVFTTHDQWSGKLEINNDGTGSIGDWRLRKNPQVDVIIIYHRTTERQLTKNNVYKGNIVNIEGPLPEYNNTSRYRVYFSNLKNMGSIAATWSDFADAGANPVRYLCTGQP